MRFVYESKTLKRKCWTQPRYQAYHKILFPSKIYCSVYNLGYREDYSFNSQGNSFIANINKNTYRMY